MKLTMREKTITISHFACEECPFETENASEAGQHEVVKRPVKEQRTLGRHTFFRFSRRDSFAAYSIEQCWEPGDWEGPGWYGLKRFNRDGTWCDRLVSADMILSHAEQALIDFTALAVGLRELLGRAAP